jgi:hypothetical protein
MDEKQLPQNEKPKGSVKRPSIFKDIINYSIKEVIEPQTKEITSSFLKSVISMGGNALSKGVDKYFYPDGNVPNKINKPNGTLHTNYNYRVYTTTSGTKQETSQQNSVSLHSKSSLDVPLVWADDEIDAKEIVTSLLEDIDNYGKVKISAYYETVREILHVKINSSMTDYRYGWTKKHRDQIGYFEDGGKYCISLPTPVNIENVEKEIQ